MLWMLLFPLFHVHPEVDSHHGEAGHIHTGTIHTVLSGDLDGEFDSHETPAPAGLGLSTHSHPWQEHTELGFSLLRDSNNRPFFHPLLIPVTLTAAAVEPTPFGRSRPDYGMTVAAPVTHLVHEVPSRAPPSSLV